MMMMSLMSIGILFSNHQRPKINAMESDPELLVEKDARAVRMSMEMVYKAFLKVGMLEEEQEEKEDQKGEHCQYHKGSVDHSIQDYFSSSWYRK